jgi:lipopolysaccharide export system permease protein
VTVLSRYLIAQYLRVFFFTLLAGMTVFLVVDLVDRIGAYAEYSPTFASMASFYVLRLPRVVNDIYPGVSLMAVLISLGLAARRREIIALRGCGVSDRQMTGPLLTVSLLLSIALLLWNETVVPPTAAEARHIKDVVIKQKRDLGMFDARSIWFQDRQGFVNIYYFDAVRETIHGLTLYDTDEQFRLKRVVEIPHAAWRGDRWELDAGTVKEISDNGSLRSRALAAGEVALTDDPSDLAKRRPHAEELTLAELRDRIAQVKAKGLNTDELRVDLHAKLAIPLSGVVGVLIGFPLAIRGGRRFGLGYNVTLGLIVGFAYWVVMGIAVSAGRTGLLHPALAAWSPNLLFAAIGLALGKLLER